MDRNELIKQAEEFLDKKDVYWDNLDGLGTIKLVSKGKAIEAMADFALFLESGK